MYKKRKKRKRKHEERESKLKLSIRMKILLPAILLIIAICTSMGIYSYTCIYDGMVEMGIEEANMASQIVIDILDADKLDTLKPGCEKTDDYQLLLNDLRKTQEKYGPKFLVNIDAKILTKY